MGNDIFYTELAKAKIQEKRNIVISLCSKGGFTIAQQLEVEEGTRTTGVFFKGAFHIDSLEGIENLRDALNVVLSESGLPSKDDVSPIAWDDEE